MDIQRTEKGALSSRRVMLDAAAQSLTQRGRTCSAQHSRSHLTRRAGSALACGSRYGSIFVLHLQLLKFYTRSVQVQIPLSAARRAPCMMSFGIWRDARARLAATAAQRRTSREGGEASAS
eukprot:1553053-Pleurochrysis_carterae.AAC.2